MQILVCDKCNHKCLNISGSAKIISDSGCCMCDKSEQKPAFVRK